MQRDSRGGDQGLLAITALCNTLRETWSREGGSLWIPWQFKYIHFRVLDVDTVLVHLILQAFAAVNWITARVYPHVKNRVGWGIIVCLTRENRTEFHEVKLRFVSDPFHGHIDAKWWLNLTVLVLEALRGPVGFQVHCCCFCAVNCVNTRTNSKLKRQKLQ